MLDVCSQLHLEICKGTYNEINYQKYDQLSTCNKNAVVVVYQPLSRDGADKKLEAFIAVQSAKVILLKFCEAKSMVLLFFKNLDQEPSLEK